MNDNFDRVLTAAVWFFGILTVIGVTGFVIALIGVFR